MQCTAIRDFSTIHMTYSQTLAWMHMQQFSLSLCEVTLSSSLATYLIDAQFVSGCQWCKRGSGIVELPNYRAKSLGHAGVWKWIQKIRLRSLWSWIFENDMIYALVSYILIVLLVFHRWSRIWNPWKYATKKTTHQTHFAALRAA